MPRVGTMVRTAVMVSDLERSTAFYRDILGLNGIYAEGELTHPAGAKLIGMPVGARVRYRIVKAEGPNRGMVGLFEISNPSPPGMTKRRDGVNVGEAVMVFYCDDTEAVHKRLIAGNHTVVCPPTVLEVRPKAGVIGAEGRSQPEMVFADPDGMLINLIQRHPDDPR
ncbi:MAG: VOC family protein [Alphaproteobacteria bacterium]|nr:VOC family protein [Alphaproteobacteria bacterium]